MDKPLEMCHGNTLAMARIIVKLIDMIEVQRNGWTLSETAMGRLEGIRLGMRTILAAEERQERVDPAILDTIVKEYFL